MHLIIALSMWFIALWGIPAIILIARITWPNYINIDKRQILGHQNLNWTDYFRLLTPPLMIYWHLDMGDCSCVRVDISKMQKDLQNLIYFLPVLCIVLLFLV